MEKSGMVVNVYSPRAEERGGQERQEGAQGSLAG